jgi:spermidine dehydrogenase
MRGSHPGSFEVAHAAVSGERWKAGRTGEHYDLVVVGAGISGLSAAYIYHRDVDPNARILILDNHDDFGGHAKRNEFTLDGRTFIGYGGTMLIESPGDYPEVAKQLIRELGIEIGRGREFGRVNYSELYETSPAVLVSAGHLMMRRCPRRLRRNSSTCLQTRKTTCPA